MSGDADPIYVAARATLLDALNALAKHRISIILVGAQAIRAARLPIASALREL